MTNDEATEKLEIWIETIYYAVTMLLDGCDSKTAFEEYENLSSNNLKQ